MSFRHVASAKINRRAGVTCLIALLGIATPHGAQQLPGRPAPQPLERGTSTIAGRVIDAQTKEPVTGAEVRVEALIGGIVRAGVIRARDDGSYRLSEIAEGQYLLVVQAPGYLTTCYANPELSQRCSPVKVLQGQASLDIHIQANKEAIARGRVVDQHGEPAEGAIVAVTCRPSGPCSSNLARGTMFSSTSATTGVGGKFELRGIPPGEWTLELLKPITMTAPVLLYPGVARPEDATPLEFFAGRVADDLVFVVPVAAENRLTVHVSTGPLAIADVRTSFIQSDPLITRAIALNDKGVGHLDALRDGRYFVSARGWIDDKAWAAFEIVDFIGPTLDLSLQMLPAGTITGKIVGANGDLPPFAGIAVNAAWIDDEKEVNPRTPDQSQLDDDGSFRIEGLFGKRALRLVGLPRDWTIVSVLQGRTDVTGGVEVPLDSTVDLRIVVARR